MATEKHLLSGPTKEYISSILGLRDPYQISLDNDVDSLQHLLFQADYLWNVGKADDATELISNKVRSHERFLEDEHNGFFCRGLEQLCQGSLPNALKEFQQAAANTEKGLLKAFFTERAVNIAFWLACSGQMLTTAKGIEDQINETPFAGGLLSFSLHMSGDSITAEKVARTAIGEGFDDPWTIHAVAHALSSQGRSNECAQWLEQHREKSSNCNAFMKGHMEFHLALCFIDMEDGLALDNLIASNLWGTMSDDMRADYWNAAGLLNALWKAEIREVTISHPSKSDFINQALHNVTSALSGVNKSKSLVFSLCIFRFTSGSLREGWKSDLITSTNDSDNVDETQQVMAALATAISIVYHSSDESQWDKAAKVIGPVADKLDKLGASPEQREVLEDFVGMIGKQSTRILQSNEMAGPIDLQSWYDRNQRPNISFYKRTIYHRESLTS